MQRFPQCLRCGSLERHRIGRAIVESIWGAERLREHKLLQISRDNTVPQSRFRETEVSVFHSQTSIDVQKIARASHSYDFIVCSHVIEHVPDHRKAIMELGRILTHRGVLLLSYPSPFTRRVTLDWGFPDFNQHGHYRVIGKDFDSEYKALLPDFFVTAVTGLDTATGARDRVCLITGSQDEVARIMLSKLEVELISRPEVLRTFRLRPYTPETAGI